MGNHLLLIACSGWREHFGLAWAAICPLHACQLREIRGIAIAQGAVIPYLSPPVPLTGQLGREKCSIIKQVGP